MTMLMLPLLGHAQQIAYDYDASGNRIKRRLVTRSRRAMETDKIQLFTATPNPVSDVLQIKYVGIATFDGEFQYSLQSINGKTVLSRTSRSMNCQVDVSGQPNGIYILNIIYKEETEGIKIIKN
mgnify:CR=1 FL=1